MEKTYLTEAFKALEELNEEVFDISFDNGFEDAKEFMEEPVDDREEEIIIDPLAETEEDLEKDYVGKAILQCEICKSMIYKNPDEVVIDEESELANVKDVCPFCQSEDGFKVIGQIEEFCDEECEENKEDEEDNHEESSEEVEVKSEEEIEEPIVDEEDLEESIKTRKKVRLKEENKEDLKEETNYEKIMKTLDSLTESSELDDIDADADDKKEKAEAEKEKADDDADADRDEKKDKLEESDKPAAVSMEDAQKWVDYDMKKYGKISERTNRLVKKAGFQIVKDDHGDYEVAAGKFESCEESLKEDFSKVDIETDREKMSMTADENGKVTVTTEPIENVEEKVEGEVIAPVSDEVKAEFKTENEVEEPVEDEYTDVEFDEFEEKDFDELGESYLKKVYENVQSFKTLNGTLKGNNLKLEGLITFKSGKQAKTQFIFEAYKATKSGKLKFIGENKQFAKGKKSFTLTGRADGKKLVCESLNYSYIGKAPDGSSKRLYGTVKK